MRRLATPDAPECVAIRGGTPYLNIGRADADQAEARPYLRRCAGTRSRHADRPDHENFLARQVLRAL